MVRAELGGRASIVSALFGAALAGCYGGGGGESAPERAAVEIGIPTGDTLLEFAPLERGGELPLETFGQGGTHVLLGVRTRGFAARAYVGFTLENLESGREVVAPAPASPQLFYCHDGLCDLVPVLVMAGGLAEPDQERDGLPIAVRVEVHDDEGAAGEAETEAVLSDHL